MIIRFLPPKMKKPTLASGLVLLKTGLAYANATRALEETPQKRYQNE